jgi:hypothetical protein
MPEPRPADWLLTAVERGDDATTIDATRQLVGPAASWATALEA